MATQGIRDLRAYANPIAPRPAAVKLSIMAQRAAASAERSAEAKTKELVERVYALLDDLEAREEELGALAKLYAKRKAALAARRERIEDRVLAEMQAAGLAHVAGLRVSFRAQQAAEALDVFDPTLVPAEFLRQPKTPPKQPDKVALKTALAKDADLDPAAWGCSLSAKTILVRR